jgi:hypothetical protein
MVGLLTTAGPKVNVKHLISTLAFAAAITVVADCRTLEHMREFPNLPEFRNYTGS